MHDYGVPPRLDVLERFARGLRLDVNEWRELAGYPRIETPTRTGAEILGAGIFALQQKYDRPYITVRNFGGRDSLSPEQAEIILRELEQQILREIEDENRTGGRPPRPNI